MLFCVAVYMLSCAESVALIPAKPRYAVMLGSNVSLVVHVASYPNTTSDDIRWSYGPANTFLLNSDNDDRKVLMNGNTTLLINSVEVEDSDTYQIHMRKEIDNVLVERMTSIELDVQGMYIHNPCFAVSDNKPVHL